MKVAKSAADVRELAQAILGMQLVTHQTGAQGQKVRRLLIEQGADIRTELYLGMVVDRVSATRRAHGELRRRHGYRRSGGQDAGEDPQGGHRSAAGSLTPPRPTRWRARSGCRRPACPRRALRCRGCIARLTKRCLAGRNQSPDRHRRGPPRGARCQIQLRRQRAVSSPGHRRDARPRRGGSGRSRSLEVRPVLHLARRRHRLSRQWRRPGDGDDGHDQALWRHAGELPRRRRRRNGREGDRGVQDHAAQSEA